MAAPTYAAEFSIGLLGTLSNLLSAPMTFYRCSTCASVIAEGASGTVSRDLHTAWHTALDTTASNASTAKTTAGQAASDASVAKASAGKSATDAASAVTTANGAAEAAGRAQTVASDAATRAKTADDAAVAANAAVSALIEQTGMCPLCRAEVATDKINVHLTYHYRRAHGDPVEFPADFDPTTADLDQVDPPMMTNMDPST